MRIDVDDNNYAGNGNEDSALLWKYRVIDTNWIERN